MKTLSIAAAAAAVSILSGVVAAKPAVPSSISFGAKYPTSFDVDSHFSFTETDRCIVRQRTFEQGEPVIKAVSECEKPIIMVFCILTVEDGWSCCSNAEYPGQPLMGRGDYHALGSRDLVESEPRNSFAVGCVPTKVGPALRTLNPLSLGSVPDDPCYLAIHGLDQALLQTPQGDPHEILKTLGFTAMARPLRPFTLSAKPFAYLRKTMLGKTG
jgi:hypothetical protein